MSPYAARPPSWLDAAICAYLALPVLIFCAWFRWPAALAFAGLFALGGVSAWSGLRPRRDRARGAAVAALLAFSFAWTALAGIGHFFYANSDWYTRDATLRDLVATRWPPAYELGPTPLILRAPLGYYLPSALVGKVAGLRAADVALYAWTALGFALFLGSAATLFPARRARLAAIAVLVVFCGLDLVGTVLLNGAYPPPGQHIQWWSGVLQYSANATLLFWVPNHALPGWLGIVLTLRHWRQPALARLAPLCAAAVTLWAPLVSVGLAPFFVAGIAWRRDGRLLASPRSALPWYAIAVAEAMYLTLDSRSIPHGWLASYFPDWILFLRVYLLFCLLEFGVLALVLLRLGADSTPLRLAIAILLLLPLYRFGQSNDLPMRASIPALTVLALATVAPLTRPGPRRWRVVLAGLLALGAVGAAQEPERTFMKPRWDQEGVSMAELYHAQPPRFETMPTNYVARLVSPALAALMREPGLVPPSVPVQPNP
jgi:hypothetical protein